MDAPTATPPSGGADALEEGAGLGDHGVALGGFLGGAAGEEDGAVAVTAAVGDLGLAEEGDGGGDGAGAAVQDMVR